MFRRSDSSTSIRSSSTDPPEIPVEDGTINSESYQGCDASVLLDGSASGPSEQEAPLSLTLRAKTFKIIEDLRELVHKECGRVASWADIVALATRDSVVLVIRLIKCFPQPLLLTLLYLCHCLLFTIINLPNYIYIYIKHLQILTMPYKHMFWNHMHFSIIFS